MKLTAAVKLLPTDDQYRALLATLERANAACNWLSEQAWQIQAFGQFGLHKLYYGDVRQQFELSAQMAVRCIGKVADSYKKDRRDKRTFKPYGAVAYDSRILNWRVPDKQVSIWTLGGRSTINFTCGKHHELLLHYQQGESDLVYRKGKFFLYTTCEVPEDTPIDVEGFLGIDLGVVNIAADSDGEVFSGAVVNGVRHRHRRLRRKLQKKSTKSAKRLLKKLAGKERRFAEHVNHTISKRIVAKAQGTSRGIVLEDLTGIRDRITVRKPQRAALHSWSFYDLRTKIEYKAKRAGVPVTLVDPRNSSRTCPHCGCMDQRNRPNQATFSCVSCGYSGLADTVAATVLSRRAAVNLPYAVSDLGQIPPELQSRLL
jgi:IS605 OrfB family transposase